MTLVDINTGREINLEEIIDSPRYELITETGRGTWGVVYRAKDIATGKIVAIKILEPTETAQKQMEHRQITPFSAIANEDWFEACSNVVPRRFEIDNNGRPFIVMPFYESFFDRELERGGRRKSINEGTILTERGIRNLRDIANGLAEMHTHDRVHGDTKPDNIAVGKNGKLLISDLGTSTCARFDWTKKEPRDNMGFLYTRDPECFREGSHPRKESDVYSFGCLAYRIFAGEYPWEKELDNAMNPEKMFENLDVDEKTKILKRKIRENIPRNFRRLIYDCLRFDYKRIDDGNKIVERLDEVVENMSLPGRLKKYVKTVGFIAYPATILGFITYSIAIHEPTEISMPQTRIKMITDPEQVYDKVEFETENFELPNATPMSILDSGAESYIRRATNNIYVAYLTRAYAMTLTPQRIEPRTDYQNALYRVTTLFSEELSGRGVMTLDLWPVVARSIEVAMNKCVREHGVIDLEDMMVATRNGYDVVERAKMVSGSEDYEVYRNAIDINGKRVIDEEEVNFVNKWLANYYSDY
jgi:serine/threonine protein kinase